MEVFVVVVGSGSMTAAAKIIGISQLAITRLVRDPETYVGFALFLIALCGRSPLPPVLLDYPGLRRAVPLPR